MVPLCVTVLVRALDTGPRVTRVWRLSATVNETGLRLRRDLPFERGRPVQVDFTLPDDDRLLTVVGVVAEVAPSPQHDAEDDDRPRPRAIAFTTLDPEARRRVARYVEERMLPS
jgi:hypothetical protein